MKDFLFGTVFALVPLLQVAQSTRRPPCHNLTVGNLVVQRTDQIAIVPVSSALIGHHHGILPLKTTAMLDNMRSVWGLWMLSGNI
jgi:hypothetical protein